MISIDEALGLVLDGLAPLSAERVPLAEAAGRVVAEATASGAGGSVSAARTA